jgi:hypothetical protein
MRMARLSTIAGAMLLILAIPFPEAARAHPDTPAKKTPTPTPGPDPLSGLLSERISGKRSIDDVRIDVSWPRGAKPTSARIYGNGIGIWDRRLQFTLPRRDVVSALQVLRDARFGAMPGSFGSDAEGEEGEEPVRLQGRIDLRIGGLTKRVAQYVDGEQSPELAAAAQKLLAICAEPGAKGKGAANLEEGLRLVAEKRLAPEVLSVVLNRRAARGDAKAEGWILRVDGRRVRNREMPAGQPPPLPRRLVLSEPDFLDLVRTLSAEQVASLPTNLYAPAYTDLRVELLDHSRDVAARQFLNVTAETHGAKQKAFDRILEKLGALHEKAQRDGVPLEERAAPMSEAEKERRREREEERKREEEREREMREAHPTPPPRPAKSPFPAAP